MAHGQGHRDDQEGTAGADDQGMRPEIGHSLGQKPSQTISRAGTKEKKMKDIFNGN